MQNEYAAHHRIFTAEVLYSAYPFVVVSNLTSMPAEDINYLEVKGCLKLPVRKYLDEFLAQYFRYIHPVMPLIDEGLFWEMYGDGNRVMYEWDPRISLLVLYSMLFASCSFVSPSTLGKLGFASAPRARRAMYQRAQLLYNMDTESSRLDIAQAALLLSYWAPPFKEAATRPNSMWLSMAIESARSVQAHQCLPATSAPTDSIERQKRLSLKRLWTCCVVRDHIMALTLRRNCQITRTNFNLSSGSILSYSELSTELHGSKIYDAVTKKSLIMTFLQLARLCLLFTDTCQLIFPYERGLKTNQPSDMDLDRAKIKACKADLDDWYETVRKRLPFAMRKGDVITNSPKLVNPSVTLFVNMIYIYYQ
jgi:hypothetical protein